MYLTIDYAYKWLTVKHGYILLWHSIPQTQYTTLVVHSDKVYSKQEAIKQHARLFSAQQYTTIQLYSIYDYVRATNDTYVLNLLTEILM